MSRAKAQRRKEKILIVLLKKLSVLASWREDKGVRDVHKNIKKVSRKGAEAQRKDFNCFVKKT
jgi:hypothetical protein